VPLPGTDIVPRLVNDPEFPATRLTPIADEEDVLEILPWLMTELLESMVIAAPLVVVVEIVTEPVGVMLMLPALPPDAAEVVSADVVAADTVRSVAELGVETAAAMALDKSTLRIFKISPFTQPPPRIPRRRREGMRKA